MPYLYDRIKETTTTTGTGTLTLDGAVSGHQTFDSVLNANDSCYYCIVDSSGNWETGIGVYNSNTLTREVNSSSNSNALVNFGAGTKTVFIDATVKYFIHNNIGSKLALNDALP